METWAAVLPFTGRLDIVGPAAHRAQLRQPFR
jgi:hypothetical protein